MAKDKAYRKAEQKIQKALKSGATELDLSNDWGTPYKEKLSELPESIGHLTQLTSLNLSRNQLTALPDTIGQLTQLTDLNLSRNQLTALPDSLGQLTQLTFLNLSDNQLTALPDSLGQLTQLTSLNLSDNQLTALPDSLGQLTQLTDLILYSNQLTALPDSLGQLTQLKKLLLSSNQLTALPDSLGQLTWIETLWLDHNRFLELPKVLAKFTRMSMLLIANGGGGIALHHLPAWLSSLSELKILGLWDCELEYLPDWIGQFTRLEFLHIADNKLKDIPSSLAQLEDLKQLDLSKNPLNPELAEAYNQGLEAVKLYLRAGAVVPTYEAKLILVGEGEVGKTCLMDALLGKEWQEHPSTHGIEIQQVKVSYSVEETEDDGEEPKKEKIITLNGWDFGGQRVYRPTHQLFFSAPAVYLVVWKPREGPQQGFVKEWIQLIKRREPTAKILVVATHGGPQQRQPDIDRQELWDLFGKETVIDFFWVDSKPDENGQRKGIEELKEAIGRVSADLPEVGRSVPKSFQEVRDVLKERNVPYLPLDDVLAICKEYKMDDEIARLFITISHRLGHLTHYQNDPILRDIVILRPDWLSTAMSYVLDDGDTRKAHGLVKLSRLSFLWDDPSRPNETRYGEKLHRVFLRLMERFDLSYRVAGLSRDEENDPVSLIAQLVPDTTPEDELEKAWPYEVSSGDSQQTQICRIVDAQSGQSANAEGLFYQLIVRLHKYSLGRISYDDSVHWQRGLVLDDEYNGRALLRHIGNDIHITVRAPYPEFFLATLTREVKFLVESFWEGLRCDVMVPCIHPCGKKAVGTGLYEVEKLIDSKRRKRPDYPCPICNEWQDIDSLLRNAPSAQPDVTTLIFAKFAEVKAELAKAREQISYLGDKTMFRFDRLDDRTRRVLSQVDKTYTDLIQIFTDEAKEGPRLFSFVPVDRSKFNPREWTRAKFRLTLWCEHSREPLTSPNLNGPKSKKGVYDIELTRDWFKKWGPYLKLLTGTLSLVLPVALSGVKLRLDDNAYKVIEEDLAFSKSVIDATIGESTKIGDFWSTTDATRLDRGEEIRAQGAMLRELHTLLKKKDPSFGGLVRVMNKRQEFLWVHEQFAKEY